MDLSKINLIIYDLDGTLYEDTHHFDYYASELKNRLAPEIQDQFQKDYEAGKKNNLPLRIGRVFDAVRKLVLVQLKGKVREVYRWDGTRLSVEEVSKIYPVGVKIDMKRMFSVGDLWWLLGCIARYYGISEEKSTEAFLATREYMMRPDFQMKRTDGLIETIAQARKNDIRQALVTNSPEPDSEKILNKLGLSDLFDEKIFNARKPTGTKEAFKQLSREFSIPYENILSVGDNWVNEIQPANELGCQTIFLDPHDSGEDLKCTLRVASISDTLPFLRKVGVSKIQALTNKR